MTLAPTVSLADDTASADDATYQVQVDAVARLFRREASPGTAGGIVAGDVAAPLYHYAMFRADGLAVPWSDDSVDVELAAWGNLEISEPGRTDGDLMIARVRQRFAFGHVDLGRQTRAGGAARFARFDGITGSVRTPFGFGFDAYGGLSVLPRWAGRERHLIVGSAADALLRDPEAFPELDREEHWLVGGRMHVEHAIGNAGVSFHEQQEQEGLARRNAALDGSLTAFDEVVLHGRAIMDVDSADVADARAVIDVYPVERLIVSTSYQRLAPSLLLSRQSVLSVFSTEAFDEWGTEVAYRPFRFLRLTTEGYVERFTEGDLGFRTGGHVRLEKAGAVPTVFGLGYRRVVETLNGYHALRASVSVRPDPRLLLATDAFVYVYDEEILGHTSSMFAVTSAGYRATDRVEMMFATSVARSPYALIDAQATARVGIALDGVLR